MGSYFGIQPPQRPDTQNRAVYTAGAGQTAFVTSYTPGYVDVYQNGVKLQVGVDFTAASGTGIVLTTGATLGDIIEIVGIHASNPYDFYTKLQSDTNFRSFYAIAVGTADALSVTTTPLVPALTDGMEIKIRVASANTGTTPTVTFSNLGIAKTITMQGNQPVPVGAWAPGQEITVRYNITTDKLEWLGVASFATAAEVVTGTAGNKAVSPSAMLAQWIGTNQSKAVSGYQKFPGGLIVQWGAGTISSAGSAFTFPIAFPSACYAVIPSIDDSAPSSRLVNTVNGSITLVGVTLCTNVTGAGRYIAIGF